jgi:hypothetical protein
MENMLGNSRYLLIRENLKNSFSSDGLTSASAAAAAVPANYTITPN